MLTLFRHCSQGFGNHSGGSLFVNSPSFFQKFKTEPSTTPVSSAVHQPPPSAPSSSSDNPQHGCQPPHHPLDHLSPSPVSNSSTAAVDPSRTLASSPAKWANNMAASSGAPESLASSPPSSAAVHQSSSRPGTKNRIPFSIVHMTSFYHFIKKKKKVSTGPSLFIGPFINRIA